MQVAPGVRRNQQAIGSRLVSMEAGQPDSTTGLAPKWAQGHPSACIPVLLKANNRRHSFWCLETVLENRFQWRCLSKGYTASAHCDRQSATWWAGPVWCLETSKPLLSLRKKREDYIDTVQRTSLLCARILLGANPDVCCLELQAQEDDNSVPFVADDAHQQRPGLQLCWNAPCATSRQNRMADRILCPIGDSDNCLE